MKFHGYLLIGSTSKLSLKIYFFAIFLVPSWFLRSMGAVAQNWLIPQQSHLNQNCRVSKSKIIMCLWSVALKAMKTAKWPRTFYMVWTVQLKVFWNNYKWLAYCLIHLLSFKDLLIIVQWTHSIVNEVTFFFNVKKHMSSSNIPFQKGMLTLDVHYIIWFRSGHKMISKLGFENSWSLNKRRIVDL